MKDDRGNKILITANVGDSVTIVRNEATGHCTTVSEEHSLVARLLQAKMITPQEAIGHPQRNVVYRLIDQINPQDTNQNIAQMTKLSNIALGPNDGVIVFSDGVTDNFSPDDFNRLSDDSAKRKLTNSQFKESITEEARMKARDPNNPLAKPDDCSSFSLK